MNNNNNGFFLLLFIATMKLYHKGRRKCQQLYEQL